MSEEFGEVLARWEKADVKRLGHFELSLFADGLVTLHLYGKGTMEGTRNIIAAFEELLKRVENGDAVRVLVDMGEMNGVPLRAQALLGKWLVKTRARVQSAALFGGSRIEVKVARTVVKIAGLTEKVGFLDSQEEALSFLRGGAG